MLVYFLTREGAEDVSAVVEQHDIRDFLEKLKLVAQHVDGALSIMPTTPAEASAMMRYFVECVQTGEAPSRWIGYWIAFAFERALSHASPEKEIARSLGIVRRRRGQPRKQNRDLAVYERMVEHVAGGCSVLEASHRCAEEFGVHEANAQKTYYHLKIWYDQFPS